jgi:archaellum component FlaF (FlaF/FlaG flagellin family)
LILQKLKGHSRRGLSTIVTTVMLVAAVGIMGSGLVVWSNSSFSIAQQQIANSTDSKINMIRENFVLEDVWFYSQGPTDYGNVTVRNTGNVAIRISHIYVNNTQVWNTGQVINATESETIQTTFNWEPDRLQSIWVKTARDSQVKQVWKS